MNARRPTFNFERPMNSVERKRWNPASRLRLAYGGQAGRVGLKEGKTRPEAASTIGGTLSVERSTLDVGSSPRGAVFLSYAAQDAEAAKRICEALRVAGIEVWFDQSEPAAKP